MDYIPKKIAFDSDSDLLKLLIAPLYGEDPSYGVRELLQNSVDACKEYKELHANDTYKPRIDVNAFEQDGRYFFEIIDNGLGMTDNTIMNYFLKAGASFRNSDVWRENFEDEEHHSKVERTGRFGVGLLAAFLFGNKIEVATKYYDSKVGYKFKTNLSDSQINIVQDRDIAVGTSIKIEMNLSKYNQLKDKNKWQQWYVLNDIEIIYNNQAKTKTLFLDDCIKIEQDELSSVEWFYKDKDAILICNGFKIPNGQIKIKSFIDIPHTSNRGYKHNHNEFNNPSFIIKDKEGRLPLTLSRDKLLKEEFSFNEVLVKSMSNELFDYIVNLNIPIVDMLINSYLKHPMVEMSSHYYQNELYTNFIYTKEGFNLFTSYMIEKNRIDKLVFIALNNNAIKTQKLSTYLNSKLSENGYFIILEQSIVANSAGYNDLIRDLDYGKIEIDKRFNIKSANITIPIENHKKIFTYKQTYLNMGVKDYLVTSNDEIKRNKGVILAEEESELWARNYFKKKNESLFELKELDEFIDEVGLIMEIYIDDTSPIINSDIEYYFYNLMEEHFKDKEHPWIPYSG